MPGRWHCASSSTIRMSARLFPACARSRTSKATSPAGDKGPGCGGAAHRAAQNIAGDRKPTKWRPIKSRQSASAAPPRPGDRHRSACFAQQFIVFRRGRVGVLWQLRPQWKARQAPQSCACRRFGRVRVRDGAHLFVHKRWRAFWTYTGSRSPWIV